MRDFLLGREVKDHDIATSASPDELEQLFPDAISVGKAFGVFKIPLDNGIFLEIATFREDLEYRDHRHPSGILIAGPREDARRRDFTINGLFYDPKSSRILDCVGGIDDLKIQVLKCIGHPKERFREDALRLLRGVRFATSLGFSLEPDTLAAMKDKAKLIQKISQERIRDELTLMLTSPRPAQAVELLAELGLLLYVLPEVDALQSLTHESVYHDGKAWRHILKLMETVVRQNPKRSATLMWAALLLEIGKPIANRKSGGKNFNSHERDAAKLVRAIGERLRFPVSETDRIASLVEDRLKFREVFQMREATLQRFIRRSDFDLLLALHRAEATVSDGNLAHYEFCKSRYDEWKAAKTQDMPRLMTGEDLIQLGFVPGPHFSEILTTIEDLILERKIASKEEALDYVVKHFVH